MGNAPEEFDTLGEIANYITEHDLEADQMQSDIESNKTSINEINEKLDSSGGTSGPGT